MRGKMNTLETSKQLLKNVLTSLADHFDSSSMTEEKISVGNLLWKNIKECSALLDRKVKPFLRSEARKRLPTEGQVKMAGMGQAMCKVVIPKKRLSLKKNTHVESLRDHLGNTLFSTLFEERVSYVPNPQNIEAVLPSLSDQQKAVLLSAIEEKEMTPRVSFEENDAWA